MVNFILYSLRPDREIALIAVDEGKGGIGTGRARGVLEQGETEVGLPALFPLVLKRGPDDGRFEAERRESVAGLCGLL